jgi:hypothetical protein
MQHSGDAPMSLSVPGAKEYSALQTREDCVPPLNEHGTTSNVARFSQARPFRLSPVFNTAQKRQAGKNPTEAVMSAQPD